MERILSLMTARHGFDFGGYRRSSLERRIRSRAEVLGIASVNAYIDYLRARPEESKALFDALFVHVTSFFRDPYAWLAFARVTLPSLKQHIAAGRSIRIWNAGCATGEETWTLLMLLEQTIGADLVNQHVRVLATDVDDAALEVARSGVYDAEQLTSVPSTLRERCFRRSGDRITVRDDLRRRATFHRHDIVHSPAVPEVDLIVCRNTLMYFDGPVRRLVLERFHRAMKTGSHIMVGWSELLLAHGDLFQPVDLGARIFERVSSVGNDGSHHRGAFVPLPSGSPCPVC